MLFRSSAIAEKILSEEQCFSLKDLAVNGSDLIRMGYRPGPALGEILDKLLTKVIDGKLNNDKEELTRYIEKHFRP